MLFPVVLAPKIFAPIHIAFEVRLLILPGKD